MKISDCVLLSFKTCKSATKVKDILNNVRKNLNMKTLIAISFIDSDFRLNKMTMTNNQKVDYSENYDWEN